jgi:hypothetical protein
MPVLLILRYNGSLVTCTVVSLTAAKFKPHISSMSGFALTYPTNRFILMILYDVCLLLAQFCNMIIFESESYVTTDGQSASLSWNKAPIWGLRPGFYYCQTVTGLLMWGALSDERADLSFIIASSPRQHSHLGSEARGTRDHISLSQIRDFFFRRLLRLAGLRWRYSTPPPHGIMIIFVSTAVAI